MSALKITASGEGRCNECDQIRHGVRFQLGVGDNAFLCWQHYRLLQEAMKPGRVEVQRVAEIVSCGSCHHSCCCGWSHQRTVTRSYGVGRGHSHGASESSGETQARGESVGISETHSEGRSSAEGWSHVSGRSDGESR